MIIVINGINPEPWTSPTASVIRAGGKPRPQLHKNARLRNYQEAVQEVIAPELTTRSELFSDDNLDLQCFFWRQIEQYQTATGRNQSRHAADASNLLKALEDALQGLVFKNDRQVRRAQTTIVKQEKNIEPKIIVLVTHMGDPPEYAWPINKNGQPIAGVPCTVFP